MRLDFEDNKALYALMGSILLVSVLAFLAAMLPYVEVWTSGGEAGVGAQSAIPKSQFAWVVASKLTVKNDAEVWDTLQVDAINEYTSDNGVSIESVDLADSDIDAEDITADSEITASNGLNVYGTADLARNVEHLGALTFITQSITHTAGSGVTGTLATVADGEVWLVYDVFIQTTETFTDTAGNDEAFTIGDGNDADGFLSASSTELASDFTEATGYADGFYGVENGSGGAYTLDDGGPFVYAPSGSSETIDYALTSGDGDDIGAGALTMYLVYARIE
jgi:hypothetical protein